MNKEQNLNTSESQQLNIADVRERFIAALDKVAGNYEGETIYIGYHNGQLDYRLSEISSDELVDAILNAL